MKVRLAVLVCLVAMMFTSTLTAEEPLAPAASVTLSVTMPGARGAKLTLKAGDFARIERESDGATVSLAARQINSDLVQVQLFVIDRSAGAEERRLVKTVDVQISGPGIVLTTAREGQREGERGPRVRSDARSILDENPVVMQLGVAGIDLPANTSTKRCTANTVAAQARGEVVANGPCTQCCISCDGWRFCGCAVEACGTSCCCTVCC